MTMRASVVAGRTAMTPRLGPSSGPIPLSQPLEPPEPPSPQPEPDSRLSTLPTPVCCCIPSLSRSQQLTVGRVLCAGNSPLSLTASPSSPIAAAETRPADLASVLPSSAVARAWLCVLLCLSPQLTTDRPPPLPGSISTGVLRSPLPLSPLFSPPSSAPRSTARLRVPLKACLPRQAGAAIASPHELGTSPPMRGCPRELHFQPHGSKSP